MEREAVTETIAPEQTFVVQRSDFVCNALRSHCGARCLCRISNA